MSHSDIALRHGVQTSGLCLGINTTKVVDTMIPMSVMAQLFDSLVSVLFLLASLHVNQLFICLIPTSHRDMVFKRVASVLESTQQKLVDTMICISAMAQLFDSLVSVLFL